MPLIDRLEKKGIKVLKLILGAVGLYIVGILIDVFLSQLVGPPDSFLVGVARYLPTNLISFSVAWMARDVKGMGAKRGFGIAAAFRCMVQLFPAVHIAYLEGSLVLSFKPLNDFSKVIALAPKGAFPFLFGVGVALGVSGFWLLADNLTERVLSLWPGYTWDETLSIVGSLLTTFMLIHEPGHIFFVFLFKIPLRGIGLLFPVGAYTAFTRSSELSIIAMWFLLMGGNIMTLLVSFIARNALYNKFSKHLGILCALSTIMNSQILPGASIDGTLAFMALWEASPALGILTATVQGLFILMATKFLHQLLQEEAYGSLPIYHDRPRSKRKSLETSLRGTQRGLDYAREHSLLGGIQF